MISRRQLLGASVAGAAIGLTGVMATRPETSIRFIGRRSSIIALLSDRPERVLFVLGEPDSELLADIPGLKTIGSSRIDLVVGTHRVLASSAARRHMNIQSTPTISIQGSASLPPIRGDITVTTGTIDVALGKATDLRLALVGPGEDDPRYFAVINCQRNRIILCSSNEVIRHLPTGGCDVLVVPGQPDEAAVHQLKPKLVVSNKPGALPDGIAQVQVHRTDPQIIRIGEGRVSVQDSQLSS